MDDGQCGSAARKTRVDSCESVRLQRFASRRSGNAFQRVVFQRRTRPLLKPGRRSNRFFLDSRKGLVRSRLPRGTNTTNSDARARRRHTRPRTHATRDTHTKPLESRHRDGVQTHLQGVAGARTSRRLRRARRFSPSRARRSRVEEKDASERRARREKTKSSISPSRPSLRLRPPPRVSARAPTPSLTRSSPRPSPRELQDLQKRPADVVQRGTEGGRRHLSLGRDDHRSRGLAVPGRTLLRRHPRASSALLARVPPSPSPVPPSLPRVASRRVVPPSPVARTALAIARRGDRGAAATGAAARGSERLASLVFFASVRRTFRR